LGFPKNKKLGKFRPLLNFICKLLSLTKIFENFYLSKDNDSWKEIMRSIIFHDFLIERGGGERVVNTLAKFFDPLIITCFYNRDYTYEEFKEKRIIHILWFPNEKIVKISPLKILRAIYFFKKHLSRFANFFNNHFDFSIISGFYSIYLAKFLKIPKIYYIQVEPLGYVFEREAYSNYFFLPHRLFYRMFLKKSELENIHSMDKIIANSNYTKNLYEEYFNVKVDRVVYPPVNISKFYFKRHSNFFLCVGRLYPHKRVHIVAKAFTKLKKEKLIIVGSGPLSNYISAISRKYSNIVYLGSVSDEKLRELYATCKAVIYMSEKEPFGIIPIEANASGKPAIVSCEGGLPETIVPGKTGIIVKPPYEENLIKEISSFDYTKFDPIKCIKNAKRFSEKLFLHRIKKEIEGIL